MDILRILLVKKEGQGSPRSLVRTLLSAMDSTNTHKTLLLSKSHTLLLISKLIHKIHEYFIEYSLIAYAKFSQYSPILMFDSQINICQQQRQNMDYVSLTTCKKQIL